MAKTLEQLQEEFESQKGKGIDQGLYDYNKGRYYEDDSYYRDERNSNYNEYKNTNPFETDIAKSIMNQYKNFGNSAAQGAAADSAASNGGNLDSFGSANANRQLLDYANQANSMVLSQNETRQDRILQYLDRMKSDAEGYYNKADSQFTNGMNYDLSIMDKVNDVTGQINANKQAGLDRQANVDAMAQQHRYDTDTLAAQNKYDQQNLGLQHKYDVETANVKGTSGSGSSGSSSDRSKIVDNYYKAFRGMLDTTSASDKTQYRYSTQKVIGQISGAVENGYLTDDEANELFIKLGITDEDFNTSTNTNTQANRHIGPYKEGYGPSSPITYKSPYLGNLFQNGTQASTNYSPTKLTKNQDTAFQAGYGPVSAAQADRLKQQGLI